jgi:hypothetical protein
VKANPKRERLALEKAQSTFLAIVRLDLTFGAHEPSRPNFKRLVDAVENLMQALALFDRVNDNGTWLHLMSSLKDAAPDAVSNEDGEALLATLERLLEMFGSAARSGLDDLRTEKYNTRAHQWVWVAADAWFREFETDPSSAVTGRFWIALDSFQQDHDARKSSVPELKYDLVKDALRERKSRPG